MRGTAIRAEPPTLHLNLDEIGGGKVVWPFRRDGKEVRRGTVMTVEEIKSISPANRASLIGRFIRVWPKAPDTSGTTPPTVTGRKAEQAERHVVSLGFNHGFNVIEGVKLNDAPVSRDEAYALAGKPAPKKRADKEH